jgi:glycosyltransferase involved in cell wall biosynthesis
MLLEAAGPALREGRLRLDIIGDGPMRGELEAMADSAGLREAVTFHGNVPHTRVQDIAVKANLLTFPSIREFGGGVVLEAMALGVVPLIVDYAGPAELVSEGTGHKVPIGSRSEIVSAFREKLEGILADPAHLVDMGARARSRVHNDFTWSAKARQIAQVYDWVLGRGAHPGDLV